MMDFIYVYVPMKINVNKAVNCLLSVLKKTNILYLLAKSIYFLDVLLCIPDFPLLINKEMP